jgi:hypothetical protein
MAKLEGSVILYAADLDELRRWIGSKDERWFDEALRAIRDDEDAGWEGDLLPVLERLLRRMVFEGQLYAGLTEDDRYYLTQLLVDLCDEYVDLDPLTEELPLDRLLPAVEELPRGGEARKQLAWLVRGRELGGDGVLWDDSGEFTPAYVGYVRRSEVARLKAELEEPVKRPGARPNSFLKQIGAAAEECARAELDLVSFVG